MLEVNVVRLDLSSPSHLNIDLFVLVLILSYVYLLYVWEVWHVCATVYIYTERNMNAQSIESPYALTTIVILLLFSYYYSGCGNQ